MFRYYFRGESVDVNELNAPMRMSLCQALSLVGAVLHIACVGPVTGDERPSLDTDGCITHD